MTSEEAKNLLSRINQEGFHYCFMHYSNFEDINDVQFHEFRLKYIDAAERLAKYIENEISN